MEEVLLQQTKAVKNNVFAVVLVEQNEPLLEDASLHALVSPHFEQLLVELEFISSPELLDLPFLVHFLLSEEFPRRDVSLGDLESLPCLESTNLMVVEFEDVEQLSLAVVLVLLVGCKQRCLVDPRHLYVLSALEQLLPNEDIGCWRRNLLQEHDQTGGWYHLSDTLHKHLLRSESFLHELKHFGLHCEHPVS